MNSSVIIVAAGSGKRFKGKIPKQYVKIKNETILNLTIKKFISLKKVKYIQLVINKDHEKLYFDSISKLKASTHFNKILSPCLGGKERSSSVKKGLIKISKLTDNPNKVLIHDAARPFISKKIIKSVISKLDNFDAVLPCIKMVDAIWKIEQNSFNLLNNRSFYFRAQTPQGFIFKKIYDAHLKNKKWAYDDISLANENNLKIIKINGSDLNIKITKPEDIKIAERYMK